MYSHMIFVIWGTQKQEVSTETQLPTGPHIIAKLCWIRQIKLTDIFKNLWWWAEIENWDSDLSPEGRFPTILRILAFLSLQIPYKIASIVLLWRNEMMSYFLEVCGNHFPGFLNAQIFWGLHIEDFCFCGKHRYFPLFSFNFVDLYSSSKMMPFTN